MPGRQSVSGAKNKRDSHSRGDHPRRDLRLVQKSRQSILLRRISSLEERKKPTHAYRHSTGKRLPRLSSQFGSNRRLTSFMLSI